MKVPNTYDTLVTRASEELTSLGSSSGEESDRSIVPEEEEENSTECSDNNNNNNNSVDYSFVEDADNDDDLKDVPTIELTHCSELQTAVLATVAKEDDSLFPETPSIVADHLVAVEDDDCEEHDLEIGCKMRLDNDMERDEQERRAEFISMTFHKSSEEERLGLCLREDAPIIVSIDRAAAGGNKKEGGGGLLADSPFQIGDVLISINTKRCSKMSSKAICTLLTKTTGDITIVAQNEGGAADLVESMATKQCLEDKCGLGFQTNRNNALVIHSIDSKGKFAASLLNTEDKILFINGLYMGRTAPLEAANIVKNSDKVSIVAKPCHERGIVVAEVKKRKAVRCLQHLMMKSSLWSDPKVLTGESPLTHSQKSNKRLGVCCCIAFMLLIMLYLVLKVLIGDGHGIGFDDSSNSSSSLPLSPDNQVLL